MPRLAGNHLPGVFARCTWTLPLKDLMRTGSAERGANKATAARRRAARRKNLLHPSKLFCVMATFTPHLSLPKCKDEPRLVNGDLDHQLEGKRDAEKTLGVAGSLL